MYAENNLSPDDFFSVVYRIKPPEGISPEQFAQDIAEEQTVEIPHASIPQELFDNRIAGYVADIRQDGNGTYTAVIRYRNDVTAFSVPQFLNVLFGNISLKENIRVVKLDLPEKLLSAFGGPRSGIDGIRRQTGVYGRPLLCTALKPMGLSNKELAVMAGSCARAGVDLIKDDHGIGDQPFSRFEERVALVAESIAAADAQTGNATLYFPNLCGPRRIIEKQAEVALRHGIRAVLLSPQLVGFDTVRYLADTYRLIVMAHPAFTGSLFTSSNGGIAPDVFLGTIFRMIGADISIFPSWGGRFPFTRRECAAVAGALTSGMPPLRSAFPAPAGGIQLHRIKEIADVYGRDAALLVGGALLGNGGNIGDSVKVFLDVLQKRFSEVRRSPEVDFGSSCEIPGTTGTRASVEPVLHRENGGWTGKIPVAYKDDGTAAFLNISRIELVGKSGTGTSFDLRYFEIGPGGFSSFEKHVHEHVIIGVRGCGILLKNGNRYPVGTNDIAYVGKLEAHQLRNERQEPFGFYCIVDHTRDRPRPVDREK